MPFAPSAEAAATKPAARPSIADVRVRRQYVCRGQKEPVVGMVIDSRDREEKEKKGERETLVGSHAIEHVREGVPARNFRRSPCHSQPGNTIREWVSLSDAAEIHRTAALTPPVSSALANDELPGSAVVFYNFLLWSVWAVHVSVSGCVGG